MLELLAQDDVLYFCGFALIFLLLYHHRTKDEDIIYFILADVFYILGELCYVTISQPTNIPIDFVFFFFVYFFIFMYFKRRTKSLIKNPTLRKNTELNTWILLTIDFFIIATLSFLIFYYFDRSLMSSQLVISNFNYGMAINLLYPVLDFLMLGYYVYINRVYISSDEKAYLPLTVGVLIWTISDFLFAFEVIFQVSAYGIGDYLQLFGIVMLIIILFLFKRNKINSDYTTIDLYQDSSKFGNFSTLINGLIFAYLAIYLYCLIEFSNSISLMITISELGVVLLGLSILRQNINNYVMKRTLINLSKDAKTDPLTGLNSRKFAFSLMRNVFISSLNLNICISALMLDIDHFKRFNDAWGHSCGDYVLITISNLIKRSLKTSNIVCRYGGEEILIVLPGIDQNKGISIAEKIRQDIEAFDFHYGKMESAVRVTVSIGGATAGNNTQNERDLIEQADAALYKAKEKRNNIFWFSSDGTVQALPYQSLIGHSAKL